MGLFSEQKNKYNKFFQLLEQMTTTRDHNKEFLATRKNFFTVYINFIKLLTLLTLLLFVCSYLPTQEHQFYMSMLFKQVFSFLIFNTVLYKLNSYYIHSKVVFYFTCLSFYIAMSSIIYMRFNSHYLQENKQLLTRLIYSNITFSNFVYIGFIPPAILHFLSYLLNTYFLLILNIKSNNDNNFFLVTFTDLLNCALSYSLFYLIALIKDKFHISESIKEKGYIKTIQFYNRIITEATNLYFCVIHNGEPVFANNTLDNFINSILDKNINKEDDKDSQDNKETDYCVDSSIDGNKENIISRFLDNLTSLSNKKTLNQVLEEIYSNHKDEVINKCKGNMNINNSRNSKYLNINNSYNNINSSNQKKTCFNNNIENESCGEYCHYDEYTYQDYYFEVYINKVEFDNKFDEVFYELELYNITKVKLVEQEIKSQSFQRQMFLGKVAHEFKTPLYGIISLCKNLREIGLNNNNINNNNNNNNSISNNNNSNASNINSNITSNINSNVNSNVNINSTNLLNNNSNINNNNNNISVDIQLQNRSINDYTQNIENISTYVVFLVTDFIQTSKGKELSVDLKKTDLKEVALFSYNILDTLLYVYNRKGKVFPYIHINPIIENYEILSDEIRLKQILLNLLSNSVKFTKFGEIRIDINIVDDDVEDNNEENNYFDNSDTHALVDNNKKRYNNNVDNEVEIIKSKNISSKNTKYVLYKNNIEIKRHSNRSNDVKKDMDNFRTSSFNLKTRNKINTIYNINNSMVSMNTAIIESSNNSKNNNNSTLKSNISNKNKKYNKNKTLNIDNTNNNNSNAINNNNNIKITKQLSKVKSNPNLNNINLNSINARIKKKLPLLVIMVSDTGSGMNTNQLDCIRDRCFDNIYVSNSNSNMFGTGLGLSISTFIAEKLQMKIEVNSVVNKGTCITLTKRCDFICNKSNSNGNSKRNSNDSSIVNKNDNVNETINMVDENINTNDENDVTYANDNYYNYNDNHCEPCYDQSNNNNTSGEITNSNFKSSSEINSNNNITISKSKCSPNRTLTNNTNKTIKTNKSTNTIKSNVNINKEISEEESINPNDSDYDDSCYNNDIPNNNYNLNNFNNFKAEISNCNSVYNDIKKDNYSISNHSNRSSDNENNDNDCIDSNYRNDSKLVNDYNENEVSVFSTSKNKVLSNNNNNNNERYSFPKVIFSRSPEINIKQTNRKISLIKKLNSIDNLSLNNNNNNINISNSISHNEYTFNNNSLQNSTNNSKICSKMNLKEQPSLFGISSQKIPILLKGNNSSLNSKSKVNSNRKINNNNNKISNNNDNYEYEIKDTLNSISSNTIDFKDLNINESFYNINSSIKRGFASKNYNRNSSFNINGYYNKRSRNNNETNEIILCNSSRNRDGGDNDKSKDCEIKEYLRDEDSKEKFDFVLNNVNNENNNDKKRKKKSSNRYIQIKSNHDVNIISDIEEVCRNIKKSSKMTYKTGRTSKTSLNSFSINNIISNNAGSINNTNNIDLFNKIKEEENCIRKNNKLPQCKKSSLKHSNSQFEKKISSRNNNNSNNNNNYNTSSTKKIKRVQVVFRSKDDIINIGNDNNTNITNNTNIDKELSFKKEKRKVFKKRSRSVVFSFSNKQNPEKANKDSLTSITNFYYDIKRKKYSFSTETFKRIKRSNNNNNNNDIFDFYKNNSKSAINSSSLNNKIISNNSNASNIFGSIINNYFDNSAVVSHPTNTQKETNKRKKQRNHKEVNNKETTKSFAIDDLELKDIKDILAETQRLEVTDIVSADSHSHNHNNSYYIIKKNDNKMRTKHTKHSNNKANNYNHVNNINPNIDLSNSNNNVSIIANTSIKDIRDIRETRDEHININTYTQTLNNNDINDINNTDKASYLNQRSLKRFKTVTNNNNNSEIDSYNYPNNHINTINSRINNKNSSSKQSFFSNSNFNFYAQRNSGLNEKNIFFSNSNNINSRVTNNSNASCNTNNLNSNHLLYYTNSNNSNPIDSLNANNNLNSNTYTNNDSFIINNNSKNAYKVINPYSCVNKLRENRNTLNINNSHCNASLARTSKYKKMGSILNNTMKHNNNANNTNTSTRGVLNHINSKNYNNNNINNINNSNTRLSVNMKKISSSNNSAIFFTKPSNINNNNNPFINNSSINDNNYNLKTNNLNSTLNNINNNLNNYNNSYKSNKKHHNSIKKHSKRPTILSPSIKQNQFNNTASNITNLSNISKTNAINNHNINNINNNSVNLNSTLNNNLILKSNNINNTNNNSNQNNLNNLSTINSVNNITNINDINDLNKINNLKNLSNIKNLNNRNSILNINSINYLKSFSHITSTKESLKEILVVDDSELIRTQIVRLFQMQVDFLKIKANILQGSDGIDILKFIKEDQEKGNNIKLIITDENMDYLKGSEALSQLKKLEKFNKIKSLPPVICITAYEDDVSRMFLLNEGGYADVIEKNPRKDKVTNILKKYLK